VALPQGHKGRVLNKYGYKTETSGNVKVSVCAQTRCDGHHSLQQTPNLLDSNTGT